MLWSRKTRTAYSFIPWSIAATSAGPSGLRQSTPATSPTNTGCSGRIETGIADFPPDKRFCAIVTCTQHRISADSRTGWSVSHVLALLFVPDPAEFVHITDSHGACPRLAVDPARPDRGNGRWRLSLPGFDVTRGRIPVQLRHGSCRSHTEA